MLRKAILFVMLAVTLLTCADNDLPERGTVIKKYISSDGTTIYRYDDAGYLTDINFYTIYDIFGADVILKYKNGKIVNVNGDSVIYENGKLAKTIYTENDTTVIIAEFQLENGRLKDKVSYLVDRPVGTLGKLHVTDTAYIHYSYDAFGNINEITTTGSSQLAHGPSIFTISGTNTSFEYDSKVSPVVNFPFELKCILSMNPGPNNIIRQYEDPPTTNWYNVAYSIQYNLDDRPIEIKETRSGIDSRIINLKYY